MKKRKKQKLYTVIYGPRSQYEEDFNVLTKARAFAKKKKAKWIINEYDNTTINYLKSK